MQNLEKAWKKLLNKLKIEQRWTAAYSPQTNGLVERTNQTLLNGIKKLSNKWPTTWDRYLAAILMGIRFTKTKTTAISPYKFLYGFKSIAQISLITAAEYLNVPEKLDEGINLLMGNSWKLRENVYKNNNKSRKVSPQIVKNVHYTPSDIVLWLVPPRMHQNKLSSM